MKSLLLALALSLSTSAFAANVDYICVSEKAGLQVVISNSIVMVAEKHADLKVFNANIDLKETRSGTLVGVATDEFFVQILDNGNEVLPGVMMITSRHFKELKCVRD